MVDMPSVVCQAAKRRARKTPTVWPQKFPPASILAGREGIVQFSVPTAGNNERTQVLLSYDLSILDFEITMKISMRMSDMLVRVCCRAEVMVSTT